MKIEAYSFGSMTVEGKVYENDLIIFPQKVRPQWWRKEGHSLKIEDLDEVIEYQPDILVVGTGAYGAMDIPASTRQDLERHKIKLIEGRTGEVYQVFNKYLQEGKKVVGAFHLTC